MNVVLMVDIKMEEVLYDGSGFSVVIVIESRFVAFPPRQMMQYVVLVKHHILAIGEVS